MTDFVQVSNAEEDYKLFLAKVNAFVQLKALSVALTNDPIYNFMSLFKRVGGAISLFDRLNQSEASLEVGRCPWSMRAKILSRTTGTSSGIVDKLINEVKNQRIRLINPLRHCKHSLMKSVRNSKKSMTM